MLARGLEYTLGGDPVVEKWLSYRERAVLGRDPKLDEMRCVTEMVRRIAAILLLRPAVSTDRKPTAVGRYAAAGS